MAGPNPRAGGLLPPTPPVVRVVGAAVLPVEEVSAAPLPQGAATETSLATVAATTAATVAATTAGLATVASTAAANSALLLAATNLVATDAAANSALLLAATNLVAAEAATNAAALLGLVATEETLDSILDVVSAPPPVSISNFPAIQAVSNTPVQNSGKTINRFVLAQGAAGTTVIAAASPGNKHKIVGVVLSMSPAGTVRFMDTTNLTGNMTLVQGSPFVLPPNPTFPWVETLTNRALSIVTVSGAAAGVIFYLTEP